MPAGSSPWCASVTPCMRLSAHERFTAVGREELR